MWKIVSKQIWNLRRSNTWITIELLAVFCLTWYIVDYFFVLACNYNIPNYRDTNHTWQVKMAEYPESHPKYRTEENDPEALVANFERMIQIIKEYPGVENIGISFHGSAPGLGNYWGMGLCKLNDTTTFAGGQKITMDPMEDFFSVFGYTTNNGKKAASVQDFNWAIPNGIVIGRSVEQTLFPNGSAIGKALEIYEKPEEQYIVIGVVDDIKRFDHQRPQNAFYLTQRLDSTNVRNAEISIRSNAFLSDVSFRETFKNEMNQKLQIGNYYLQSVNAYTKIEKNTNRTFGLDNNIKIRIYLMLFFLLNILLCMMGTFWYRINQRPNEIGLRKAMGATNVSIRNILFMEGLILLALVVVPAMLIEFQFVHAGLIDTLGKNEQNEGYFPDQTFLRFMITNAITCIIMASIIILAIWLPARKAAILPAAEALRAE